MASVKPSFIQVPIHNDRVFQFNNFTTYFFSKDWVSRDYITGSVKKFLEDRSFKLNVDTGSFDPLIDDGWPINKLTLTVRNCTEDILEQIDDVSNEYFDSNGFANNKHVDPYGTIEVFTYSTGDAIFPNEFIKYILNIIRDYIGYLHLTEVKRKMSNHDISNNMVVCQDVKIRNINLKGMKFKTLSTTKDKKGGILILADFGKDIGGSCLDGELPHHSCIFLPIDKAEKVSTPKKVSKKT